jgi:hypothetical protein
MLYHSRLYGSVDVVRLSSCRYAFLGYDFFLLFTDGPSTPLPPLLDLLARMQAQTRA